MRQIAASLIAAMLVIPSVRASAQTTIVDSESALDTRIGTAAPSLFKAVCDEKDWRNPLLGMTSGGVWLRSLSQPMPTLVAVVDLRRTLTELPVTDWPYGRIVAIPKDNPEAFNAVRKSLAALRLGWWVWPHACANAVGSSR